MDQEDEIDPRYELRLGAGRSLPEAIADKIRELVDNGTFKPSTKLPNESGRARHRGTDLFGVCDVKRGVGWYVRRVPVQATDGAAGLLAGKRYAVADLFEVRIGLEGLAASLAAVRATPGEIDDIAKYNAEHLDAGDDPEELLRTDIAFHESIVRASRNELLLESYQQVVGELTDWRYRSYSDRGVPLRSAREHAKVVRFLRNHDPSGARAAMNGHLHRLYDGLPEISGEPLDSTDSGLDGEPEWPNRQVDL